MSFWRKLAFPLLVALVLLIAGAAAVTAQAANGVPTPLEKIVAKLIKKQKHDDELERREALARQERARQINQLRRKINYHRRKTCYYKKIAFRPCGKPTYRERRIIGIAYLRWMRDTWKRRHFRVKRDVATFKYADRPLPPEKAMIVGQRMAAKLYGWTGWQWHCLKDLWGRLESSWRWWADNPGSDAYGIPQALPGEKMGPGWVRSVYRQIKWGLRYIKTHASFQTPCEARDYRLANGSY